MARKRLPQVLVAILVLGAGIARGDVVLGLGNYWPLDEGKGTVAHDIISHHNGALTNFEFDAADGWRPGGGIAPVAVPRNFSVQFDGIDDYINLGNFSIPETASISAWVNIHGFTGSPNNNAFYILGAETSNYGTITYVQSDGSVWITDRDANGGTDSLHTAAGIVAADDKWHQITFLRDSSTPLAGPAPSGIESIYVDGIKRAQGVTHWSYNNLLAPGAIGMGYPMLGPLMAPTPAPAYADGLIDNVRVYNRLLTATSSAVDQPGGGEIATLLSATAPLVGDANLDDSVTGADLSLLLSRWNQAGANWLVGDFNSDGSVTGADLSLLLADYNQVATNTAAPASVSVPEPSSLLLLLAGLGLAVFARKRTAVSG